MEIVYFPSPPNLPRIVHLKSFNRLDELAPRTASLADLLRGSVNKDYVVRPAGLAFHDGRLYICDAELAVVHDWDLRTGQARRWGQSGDVRLSKPVAVAVSDDGRVFVADAGRGEVMVFDPEDGSLRRLRPADRAEWRPTAIAVAGSKVYVGDIHAHQIDVLDRDTGLLDESFGGAGSIAGRMYFPMGIAVNGEGRMAISDMMNSRVQMFDAQYRFLWSAGQPGNRYGDMGKPRHLAVGPDGALFVADAEFSHIHVWDERGRLLMLFGGPEDRAGGTPMPVGVAVAPVVPDHIAALVPTDFDAGYFVFVSNSVGGKRISLYAVGARRESAGR
jgi:DNA-binding beta-propeller fold protein YncE